MADRFLRTSFKYETCLWSAEFLLSDSRWIGFIQDMEQARGFELLKLTEHVVKMLTKVQGIVLAQP